MEAVMKALIKKETNMPTPTLHQLISQSWELISPQWPLEPFAACNPLLAFEKNDFSKACHLVSLYFDNDKIPAPLKAINRETMKWCQVFFGNKQTVIGMPYREKGLYESWRRLVNYDKKIHQNDMAKKKWLASLDNNPINTIETVLNDLQIAPDDRLLFLRLSLSYLPGWASYIKYLAQWQNNTDSVKSDTLFIEYLAIRLVITLMLWPTAKEMISKFKLREQEHQKKTFDDIYTQMTRDYNQDLVQQLMKATPAKNKASVSHQLQWLFCMDVRSEGPRKILESFDHETFGVAGFFGLPVALKTSKTSVPLVPVILKPNYTTWQKEKSKEQNKSLFKRLYQSVKYNMLSPFLLAETFGLLSGIQMLYKTIYPFFVGTFRQKPTHRQCALSLEHDIPVANQVIMAESLLLSIGLTDHFAHRIIIVGHDSKTTNNAYANSLQCGACGGNGGKVSAQLMVDILNNPAVRQGLLEKNIKIPENTQFVAAIHNTTTDDIELLKDLPAEYRDIINDQLESVKNINAQHRFAKLNVSATNNPVANAATHAHDWAQTRAEWGLANNASIIIGPRSLHQSLDLSGRAFLHSYDCRYDKNGTMLEKILTGPLIVAHWINSQYLFSTLNPALFSSGSKVTQNITGRLHVMQGNASDLMHGLPLQSVFRDNKTRYHTPVRLTAYIYAPSHVVVRIVKQFKQLKQLVENRWLDLYIIESHQKAFRLNRHLSLSDLKAC